MLKHFHHKPTFSGNLTGAINSDGTTVTGTAVVKVLNNHHDSHFRVATYVGAYGTLVIAANGAWTYTLDTGNGAVSGLAPAAHLTDSILVRSRYNYRGHKGVNIIITITGAA
jgi:VCBS repeat-containing protein